MDERRWESALMTGAWLAGVLILLGWITAAVTADDETLRLRLFRWEPVVLDCCLVIAAAALALCCRKLLSAPRRSTSAALLAVLAAAALLVIFAPPRTNRIFYDEQIYQSIAQAIAETGQSLWCRYCEAEDGFRVLEAEFNKQPVGHPWYISLFYGGAGVGESQAHAANIAAFLLGTAAVFTCGAMIVSVRAGFFSALIFLLTPQVLLWSATTSAEPSAAASAAAAVCAAVFYLQRPAYCSAVLAAAAAAAAVYFRPESLLILPVLGVLLLEIRPGEVLRARFWWAAALFLLLAGPHFLHLYAVRDANWGTSGEKMSLSFFAGNIQTNGWYYLVNQRIPAMFTFFALAGLVHPGRLAVPLWFLLSWGVFLFFYAGSYDYGADVRYSLISAPAFALLAGAGASRLSTANWSAAGRRLMTGLVCALIVVPWLSFMPLITAVGKEAEQARSDVECARSLARSLPAKSLVFTHNPGMWLVWGKNAAQTAESFDDRVRVEKEIRSLYPGGLYFHWNYWCIVPDPEQNRTCQRVRENYRLDFLADCDRGGDRYILYRLEQK